MIIQSLHIDHFGKWNGLTLQHLEGGINLFYGPNETGKTTLMQFLRTVFYGFSVDRLSYVFAKSPEKTGGEIQARTEYGLFTVSRHLVAPSNWESATETKKEGISNEKGTSKTKNPERLFEGKKGKLELENSDLPFYLHDSFRGYYKTRSLEDGLFITNEKGVCQDVSPWLNLLNLAIGINISKSKGEDDGRFGNNLEINETLFNNIFAIGLQELQKLSVLNSTEAAKHLYDLSTGVLRYSTRKILAKLIQSRQKILSENTIPEALKIEDIQWCNEIAIPLFLKETFKTQQFPTCEISSLLNYRQILQKQKENIQTQNKKYEKIYTERFQLNKKIQSLTDEIQQIRHKIHILEIAQNVQEVWSQRAELDSQIVSFTAQNPSLAEASDRYIEILYENQKKIEKLQTEIKSLLNERLDIQKQLTSLKSKQSEIKLNSELLQVISSLESFLQQREWIESLRGRLDDLHRQQLDSEAQLAIDYRRIGIQLPDFVAITSLEKVFPYDVRALRPLRSPSREMLRIRKQIQTEKKCRQQLLLEADRNGQNINNYLISCRSRIENFPQVRLLPGMEHFPDVFLVTKNEITENKQSGINNLKSSNNFHPTDSRIVNEIPPEILAKNSNSAQHQNEESVTGFPQIDINALTSFLGEFLTNLRRSEVYASQLAQVLKNLLPLQKERNEAICKRILPLRELYILGGIFTFGLTLTFFEVLRLTDILPTVTYGTFTFLTHLMFFVLGLLICFTSVFYRVVYSQKNETKIADLDDSISTMLQQRTRLIRLVFSSREDEVLGLQHPEILELCSSETEKKAGQIVFIEKELQEAEKAALNLSRRSALFQEAKHHIVRLHKLIHSYLQAKARRTEVLKSLNLPENWKSSNIRILLDASDRILELWRRRSRDLEDFQLYSQELQLLVERLQALLPVLGSNFQQEMQGGDERFPFQPGIFTEIQARIQKEKEREQNFHEIQRKIRTINIHLHKLKLEYKKKRANYDQLLENSGVKDENSLKTKLERLNTLKDLREKRRDFQKEIDSTVEFSCTESMLWEIYENNSPKQIEEKRKVLQNSLDENEFQLETAQKREKECSDILEKIISDDSPTRIQYALMKTEAQIGHAINSWRAFAMTQRLVETIQRTYQLKRQPQTLECASGFLREMTDGKYERVWTPLDEDILFVQRADGTLFSTEQLSTGTRELLYLAIRLALIDEYRQKNIHLPVILDDVLVNFDRVRATAAAKVLTKFAGNQTQILFFTSHEHIREIFLKENALICDMEKRKAKDSPSTTDY